MIVRQCIENGNPLTQITVESAFREGQCCRITRHCQMAVVSHNDLAHEGPLAWPSLYLWSQLNDPYHNDKSTPVARRGRKARSLQFHGDRPVAESDPAT